MKNKIQAFLVIGALSVLNITAQETEEIVVTASFVSSETKGTLHVLDVDDINTAANSSLGEAIDDLLGISSADYGSAVGQPIIRGVSGSRVRVLDNGVVNRDASPLGPDHPNDIDLNNIYQIEVIKGPASLLYANGSIGGVINIVDNTISKVDFDKPSFQLGLESQSVNDGESQNFSYRDNVGGLNIVLSHKSSEFGNFDIPSGAIMHEEEEHHDEEEEHHDEEEEHHDDAGFLANSDYELESTSIGISKTGDWGYFGISAKSLENMYGIPFHGDGHGDEHGEEEEHEGERIFAATDSDKFDLMGSLNIDGSIFSSVDYFIRDTDYELVENHTEEEEHHDEDEDEEHDEHGHEEGPTTFANKATEFGYTFNLADTSLFSQKLAFNFAEEESSVIGSESFMEPATSEETTVGYYISGDYGLFKLDAGFRIDNIDRQGSITTHEEHHDEEEEHHDEEEEHHDEEETETVNYNRDFDNRSFAIALSRDLNESLSLEIGTSVVERAPSVTELFMNGPHLATQRFEVGNTNLDVETARNVEFTLRYANEGVYASFTAFQNDIDDYIYLQDESEEEHADHDEEHEEGHDDHEGLTLANFLQESAEFRGYELEIGRVYDLGSGLLDISYARDELTASFNDGHDVPRITPARNLYSLSYSKGSMLFKLLLKDVDKQDEIGEGETSTDGYQMLNARLTKTFDLGNSNLSVSIFGNNLLDEVARNHSSYVKSEVPLPGKNYGVKFNLNF